MAADKPRPLLQNSLVQNNFFSVQNSFEPMKVDKYNKDIFLNANIVVAHYVVWILGISFIGSC